MGGGSGGSSWYALSFQAPKKEEAGGVAREFTFLFKSLTISNFFLI